MKKNRQFILWVLVEILLAFLVHWFLFERRHGFARTRSWLPKVTGADQPPTDAV